MCVCVCVGVCVCVCVCVCVYIYIQQKHTFFSENFSQMNRVLPSLI